MSTFEDTVLTNLGTINDHFATINKRLGIIELRVSGGKDDPHNRGIYGAVTDVTKEVDAIKERQREDMNTINEKHLKITDDISNVEDEQTRQKAWLKGAAASAGLNAAGVSVVLVKLFS